MIFSEPGSRISLCRSSSSSSDFNLMDDIDLIRKRVRDITKIKNQQSGFEEAVTELVLSKPSSRRRKVSIKYSVSKNKVLLL